MKLSLDIAKTGGSKSWFVPHALEYLGRRRPKTIVEPFVGSGIMGPGLLSGGVLPSNSDEPLVQQSRQS